MSHPAEVDVIILAALVAKELTGSKRALLHKRRCLRRGYSLPERYSKTVGKRSVSDNNKEEGGENKFDKASLDTRQVELSLVIIIMNSMFCAMNDVGYCWLLSVFSSDLSSLTSGRKYNWFDAVRGNRAEDLNFQRESLPIRPLLE